MKIKPFDTTRTLNSSASGSSAKTSSLIRFPKCGGSVPAVSGSACSSSSVERGGLFAASASVPSVVKREAWSVKRRTWCAFAAAWLAASTAHAQYTNNYQTNTYDGAAASINWTNGNLITYYVGDTNRGDVLQVLGGAQLTNAAGFVGNTAAASNNLVVVSGSNSLWKNTGMLVLGVVSAGNQMVITAGGRVENTFGFVGGSTTGASNNLMVVAGSGSVWSNMNYMMVGSWGSNNRLIISNGGSVFVDPTKTVTVGGNTNAARNTVWIESGGLLDANSLIVTNGSGNSITNFGGIFQFSASAPTIRTNSGGFFPVGGSIVLTNGTIAFRNIATADVKGNWSVSQLTNITFQGNNTFRLNAASNNTSGQDYVFDQGLGATNYVGLEMINGATAWRGGSLTIGSGGTLLVSNTAARIAGALTNSGTMTVVNGSVVYGGNVVNVGAYVSDPSTNNFNGTFTVGPTATVTAAAGDIYALGGDLVMQSTNRAFNMSLAQAVFTTNGYGIATTTPNHTLNLTNSGAMDMGSNGFMSAVQLATNFSIGTLSIALSNNLTVTGNKSGSLTNALYVGWLDLTAWNTNASSLSTTLSNALTLTDINLYYDAGDSRNAYLQNAQYDLWGGQGLLIPIPEPSTAGLVLGGALFSAWLLRRKGGRR